MSLHATTEKSIAYVGARLWNKIYNEVDALLKTTSYRRLAACTQAVVILRSTRYIVIELNGLCLTSLEIQLNRSAFNRIYNKILDRD